METIKIVESIEVTMHFLKSQVYMGHSFFHRGRKRTWRWLERRTGTVFVNIERVNGNNHYTSI